MIVLRILLGAAFTTLFCLAAGDLLLHSLRLTLDRAGRRFAPFLLGAVLVSTFVFGLCSLRQFNTALLVISGTCTLAGPLNNRLSSTIRNSRKKRRPKNTRRASRMRPSNLKKRPVSERRDMEVPVGTM